MQENRNDTITNALKKIHSRFELINVAARRAREIQNYEANVNKARIKLRNTSTLTIAQARANSRNGLRENQVEATLKSLEENPIKIYVDTEKGEKPTITALREIEAGLVDKEFLDRQTQMSEIKNAKVSYEEAKKLAEDTDINDLDDEFDYEDLDEDFEDYEN